MTRRCSHCSHNGHNSRTCPNRGVKLFGVRLTDGSIRKSASMGNLIHVHQSSAVLESPGDTPDYPSARSGAVEGYASEDFVVGSSSGRERKKGVPWTEEEHRLFLFGLRKLGKGDWKGIAENYVVSRTPTQVASHAQKYFIRQIKVTRRKRRSSLFDIIVDEFVDNPVQSRDRDFFSVNPDANKNSTPPPVAVEEECESMESANYKNAESALPQPKVPQYSLPIVYPAYVAPVFPFPIGPVSFWPVFSAAEQQLEPRDGLEKEEVHRVLKPTAIHAKTPINADELVGMSKLSLTECIPSAPSLKLIDASARPSAFHVNPGSGNGSRHNPIHAV